jgi:hypothetical protein
MNGFILYRGPSEIDGKPIVVAVVGLETGGSNSKTGSMAQVYILPDGINPIKAIHTGDDHSVCGTCIHRGRIVIDPKTGLRKNVDRTCYVTMFRGPRVVYDGLQRGLYPDVPLSRARRLLAHLRMRVGAYGDPGAVPMSIWDVALDRVAELNSYTHLWKQFPMLSAFCMASVDTEEEREEAKALGFRTYRVRCTDDPVLKGEGQCPASNELGKAVQCAQCMLCGGARTNAKADITIIAHGVGAKRFERAREMA